MARKVNTKFVVLLSAGLVLLFCGVAAVGYMSLSGRPARWVAKGDALVAEGKYDEAAKLYERAVGHDRTRVDWLVKWRDTLVLTTPDNRARYESQYRFYRSILRQIAALKPRDPDLQLQYILEVDRMVRNVGVTRPGLEQIIEETTDRLKDLDPASAGAVRLMRYRGIAAVERMGIIEAKPEERELAKRDLEAAIALDAKDVEARIGLARWHAEEANRYRTARQFEEETQLRTQADTLYTALSKDFPEDPSVALAVFGYIQSEKLRAVTNPQERIELVRTMRDDALNLIDVTLSSGDKASADLVDRVCATTLRIAGNDAIAPLTALVDRTLQRFPNEPRLMMMKGLLLQESGKLDESIAELQKIVDMPDRPVSLEGLLLPGQRMSAMAMQIDSAIYMWNEAKTPEERDAALVKAREYRDRLAKDAGLQGKDQLLLRDAKIAYAERQYSVCIAKLSELRSGGSAAGRELETLQVLSQALIQQGTLGEAKRVLNEMIAQAPSMAWAHYHLGEVCARLSEAEQALASFSAAVQLDPENTQYRERYQTLQTALGKVGEGDKADPIVLGILEVRRIRDEQGDLAAARIKLDDLWQRYPEDRRVLNELVNLDMREGMKEVALKRIETLLEKYPDDRELNRMQAQLKISDPVEAALAVIEGSKIAPELKALERSKVYLQARRPDEAAAALAEAERLNPEDPQVLDMAFVTALGAKDFEKAQTLAKTAARLDVDQLGGLLYQGRLQLIEGETNPDKLQAAVRTFEDAVKRVPMNPTIRKLLAQAYERVGRRAEAAETYARAIEGKPDDLIMARDYIGVLLRLNRGPEALRAVAPDTGILRFHPVNRELLSIWMDLEGRFGDVGKAARAREGLYKIEPKDTANAYAYAELLTRQERWDDAGKVIDDLEKREDVNKLGVANLRANLLANKGDVDAGVEAIKSAITDKLTPRETTIAYLALGDYYKRNGRIDEAAAAIRKARDTQDTKVMEADRQLGDMYFDMATSKSQEAAALTDGGETELAETRRTESERLLREAVTSYEAVYKAVSENKADQQLLAKRLAETHLRLRDLTAAEKYVGLATDEEGRDVQLLLLQGAIATEQGDRRKARAFYDRAVTIDPGNPNVFLQRALFNQSVDDKDLRASLLPDVIQDLEQATKLRPGLISAWTRRYNLLKEAGRGEEAITALRKAIDANRQSDDLRLMLCRELAGAGRIEEMQQEVIRAANEREEEIRWLRLGARLLAAPGIERYKESAELLERYWSRKPEPEVAVELLDVYLRPGTGVTRQRVQQLLVEFEKIAKPDDVFDQMLKARARTFTGQNDLAERLLSDTLTMIGDEGPRARIFMTYLILARGSEASAIDWLKSKAKIGPINPFLTNLILSSRRSEERPERLIAQAKELYPRAADDVTRIEIQRLISTVAYTNRDWQGTVEAAKSVIDTIEKQPNPERNPAYAEMLNNLAYTLVTHLDQASEGIPYAEKAAAILPNANVLDTLGWAYHKVGQHGKAVDTLTKASQVAVRRDESFIANVHLGLALIDAGNKMEAQKALRRAEDDATKTDLSKVPEYQTLFESLRKAVE